MIKHGRQVATTIDGIRDDHVARYRYAAAEARRIHATRIADVGAGTGYGSWLLAKETDADVFGYEIDPDAVAFGEEHYAHPRVTRRAANLVTARLRDVDLITAFEIIEHFNEAPEFLAKATKRARFLVGSVPNQEMIPFDPVKHERHVRHYTPAELRDELETAGWEIRFLGGQIGKRGPDAAVGPLTSKVRTLVFVAKAA
jgi:2-polyprenyl-3-methyl-5-hydroxy-6-metoxy-1,4-benzoquinol methylase